MNTKNATRTFVVALAMTLALAIAPALSSGQNKADKQSVTAPQDQEGSDLVGVWESIGQSAFADCQTGTPDPDSPKIRVLYTFNQGGTMTEASTDPIDGPYRTSSQGIWKRTGERTFTTVYTHYSFSPDRTFTVTVKLKTNITLSEDANSLSESGTFEVLDPNDNNNVVFSGCLNNTGAPYKRLRFDAPQNTAPTVTITSPTNNAVFSTRDTITVVASASSPNGIAKVEFFSGDYKLSEDTTAPYTYSQGNVNPGTYTITAVATDNRGVATRSNPITIIVR